MGKDGFYFKMVWIILILFGFISCNNTGTKIDQSAESFKIYRLLIRQYYGDDEEETIMINQYSENLGDPFYYEQFLYRIPIDCEALEDFIKKNRDASNIASEFPLDGRYRFLSFSHPKDPKEHDRKLKNYMNRVKKLSPYSGKKIIEFSKVGFNKKTNQAIVAYRIYGTSLTLFSRGADTSDNDTIVLGGIVLLEKKMGPPPHIWTIKNPHLEYHN